MGKSQNLYIKAKKIIPGGTQLLSKRPEMFLPDLWPSYYKAARGVEVWDLDERKYYDMGIMGIGTCVLGYANEQINKAVKSSIDTGSMSTLNAPEEVSLAEKLIQLHPWSDKVRFARTGGEAVSIAIRIARAHANKSKVAFCGYHGWHDWYLSANLNDKNGLSNQLLPGLSPVGIPKELKNTSFPFNYGDYDQFDQIISDESDELGVVIMEVQRYKNLDLDFLNHVREVTSKRNIVLIFDEISSGFRVNVGGIHLLHGITPDMAIFGKALGNGFSISAIIGNNRVMSAAQSSFISSSYWTERTGYVAALETLNFYEKFHVIQRISELGRYIRKGLKEIFTELDLEISAEGGLDSVVSIDIKEENPSVIKTFFIQEMLERGFLASTLIYVSFAHSEEIIDLYIHHCREVFGVVAENKKNLETLLKSDVCHTGFYRLN